MWWSSPQLKHLMAILLNLLSSLSTNESTQKGSVYTWSNLMHQLRHNNRHAGLGLGVGVGTRARARARGRARARSWGRN